MSSKAAARGSSQAIGSLEYLKNELAGKDLSSTRVYYSNEQQGSLIYHGDCRSVLSALPDSCVDTIFADPPYFGNQSGLSMRRTDGHGESFRTDKAAWANRKSLAYQFEFHYGWLREAQRVLKDGSTIWVTGTYHSIGVINVVLQDLGFKILNDVVLHKKNAPPNFKGSCFRAVTENMLWAKKNSKGKLKFNYWEMKERNGGKQMSNLWSYSAKKNPFRHPATKQKEVVEIALLASTCPGDLVLDPFAGSGTTGVVSKALGRMALLVETEESYCKLASERLEGAFNE